VFCVVSFSPKCVSATALWTELGLLQHSHATVLTNRALLHHMHAIISNAWHFCDNIVSNDSGTLLRGKRFFCPVARLSPYIFCGRRAHIFLTYRWKPALWARPLGPPPKGQALQAGPTGAEAVRPAERAQRIKTNALRPAYRYRSLSAALRQRLQGVLKRFEGEASLTSSELPAGA